MLEVLIGKALGQMLNGIQTQDPAVHELRLWMSALLETAPGRWRAALQSRTACSAHGCIHPAVGACVVCKKPTCLGHGLVSSAAEIMCVECAKIAVATNGGRAAPQQPQRPSAAELFAAHLKTMGLKKTASLDDVRVAFKKLAIKYHPDKQQPAKKEAAAAKFAKITEAYHWLIDHMQKAAA